jgi:putative ABC transport system permease protein
MSDRHIRPSQPAEPSETAEPTGSRDERGAPPAPNRPMPRLATALLRLGLPHAERREVLDEVAAEYVERAAASGRRAASRWLWRQAVTSLPALAGRGWWRGWSGFEPRADRWRPGGAVLEGWAKDVRYTLRRLGRRRTYTGLTVLTLSLGIAGTAAVGGIAKRLLVEPLPVAAEEEVVVFWAEGAWSQAEFHYLRPQMDGFRSSAAFRRVDLTLEGADGPARLVTAATGTAELFEVLGVGPALGPGFSAGDDVVGAEPVVMLSHSLWRELGGSPSLVGESVTLSGVAHTVAGVMPPGFWFPDPTARAWTVLQLNPENRAGNYGVIARMPPGAGLAAMSGPQEQIGTLLREQFGPYPEEWDITVNMELTPLREYVVGSARPALLALLAAMAVILLIACVNVAALMLGQVDSRGTELAVRNALGAGRGRMLQQLVVESLVIGALAGLVGAVLALVVFRFMVDALPLGALAETATVDWTLFGGAMALGLVAATALALVPGVTVARGDLQGRLTRSRTGGIAGRGGRLESGLVVAQVALVLLMAAGAALLIRSVANLRAIDPGVRTAGVGVVDVAIPVTTPAARRPGLVAELVAAVESLPGVTSAAAAQRIPLRGSSNNWGISVESRPDLEQTTTAFRPVTADYFETMGIAVRSGRGLLGTDALSTEEGAVVINQALADRYFPGVDPLGQRISFMGRWDRVVGVVENVAESGLTDGPVPARYMLYEHVPWLLPAESIVFRVDGGRDPAPLLDAARRAIQTAAPGVAIRELTTMGSVFNRAMGSSRQVMALLSLLGALALALGVVGVYGVVSHFVTRRQRDWAIRIAIGLRPARVVGQVLRQGGTLVGAGVALGLVAFLVLARLLAGFVYGIEPSDPASLAAAVAILLAAGLLAAFVPARRASRIDPAGALKDS